MVSSVSLHKANAIQLMGHQVLVSPLVPFMNLKITRAIYQGQGFQVEVMWILILIGSCEIYNPRLTLSRQKQVCMVARSVIPEATLEAHWHLLKPGWRSMWKEKRNSVGKLPSQETIPSNSSQQWCTQHWWKHVVRSICGCWASPRYALLSSFFTIIIKKKKCTWKFGEFINCHTLEVFKKRVKVTSAASQRRSM